MTIVVSGMISWLYVDRDVILCFLFEGFTYFCILLFVVYDRRFPPFLVVLVTD